MADRPNIKDMMAKIRAGGPVSSSPSEPAATLPASEPESAAAPAVSAPEVAAAPAPTAESLGRPLTLKEKLAAARAGAAPAIPAATPKMPAASAPAPAASATEPPSGAPAVPPPAPSIGRPLTLKEKLAASRGGAVAPSAGGAAPAAKPAAAAAASSKPTATSARALPPLEESTDPRDVAEHLRRAGADKEKADKAAAATAAASAAGATPAAAKAAAAKKLETKVVPPKPGKDASTGTATATAPAPAPIPRRPFLWGMGWIIIGWGMFAAAMGTLTVACGRFLFPNVLAEPPSTIKVGLASNFEKDQVNERWKAEWGFWIVRSSAYDGEDKIYAIQSVCTHLGCPPNWLAGEQKFKCPCHGSGFYISGVNFEGPAPRPLERFKVSVNDANEIVVDKSQKFQEELKQWDNPDSFIVA